MPSLGTRRFFKPLPGSTGADPVQVMKMSGYLNITLHAVHYRSRGNIWQDIFGGTDAVTLKSQVTYHYGEKSVTAATVQDVRRVDANSSSYLGLSRLVALKVPADADGMELQVEIAAVESDNFQAGLDLLNSEEFQKPLQLAPPVIGQILTITSLVKKTFSSVGPQKRLEATYPGIISQEQAASPLENGRLVIGYLILIAEDEGLGSLDGIDPARLSVEADSLKYGGKAMDHTYIIYGISLDRRRGLSPKAEWYKKFQSSMSKLDELITAFDEKAQKDIYNAAVNLYIAGAALLDNDETYLEEERNEIKRKAFLDLKKRYQELTAGLLEQAIANAAANIPEVAKAVGGAASIDLTTFDRSRLDAMAQEALSRIESADLATMVGLEHISAEALESSADDYMKILSDEGMTFSWDLR